MKVSSQWLIDLIDAKITTDELVVALEKGGVEVDEVIPAHQLDAAIIVGEVVSLAPHPDADKLKVCSVSVGDAQYQIVCGAPNVAEGMRVAVATVGSVLPDGTKITATKLRGIESNGMLCSARELGLGDDHAGLIDLGAEVTIGKPVRDFLGHDDVLDIASPAANRWDLLSMVGLAREAASQLGVSVVEQQAAVLPDGDGQAAAHLGEIDGDLVSRFSLTRLVVDRSRRSPQWLQRRLLAAGVRPVDIVVDITNYVLLETGQPLHAYDAATINGSVGVRLAHSGETVVTLDGVTRELDPQDLIIVDDSGAIALAGVMGGQSTEVTEATAEILLEAATFSAVHIRKTAQRHTLRSDASARFERTVPLKSIDEGRSRAVQLLIEHADAKLIGVPVDSSKADVENTTVTTIEVTAEWLSARIGIEVSTEHIIDTLSRLTFTATTAGEVITVTAPWWRTDVTIPEDIAEELVKLIGYDAIPATLPAYRSDSATVDHTQAVLWRAKDALRAFGLFEVVTYSFIGHDAAAAAKVSTDALLKLKNPLSTEQAYLRDNLLVSLAATAGRNRMYSDCFGMFELSRVYIAQKAGELPQEPTCLGAIIVDGATEQGYAPIKAAADRLMSALGVTARYIPGPQGADSKGLWYPLRWAEVQVDGITVGKIGQLHPDITGAHKLPEATGYIELNWDALRGQAQPVIARMRSRYPQVRRDLSVVVARDVHWAAIGEAVRDAAIEHVQAVRFASDYYDVALGEGHKSITIQIEIGANDRTLTSKQADMAQAAVAELLRTTFDAQNR